MLLKREQVYYIPLWLPVALALLLLSSLIWGDIARLAGDLAETAAAWIEGRDTRELAAFYAPSVQRWADELDGWAREHAVDRDLLATVMQIESCGHPRVISGAGARGLFQVMPYHFAEDEDMLDPAVNARRGAGYLNYCHGLTEGVIGLTLACYNGGPGALSQTRENWSHETQKYYRWGIGIYADAAAGRRGSETLDAWLQAGGDRLCDSALQELERQSAAESASS